MKTIGLTGIVMATLVSTCATEETRQQDTKSEFRVKLEYISGRNFAFPVYIKIESPTSEKILSIEVTEDGKALNDLAAQLRALGPKFYRNLDIHTSEGTHTYLVKVIGENGGYGESQKVMLYVLRDGTITDRLADKDKTPPEIRSFEIQKSSTDPITVNVHYEAIDDTRIATVNLYFVDQKVPARTSDKSNGIFTIKHKRGNVNYRLEAIDDSGNKTEETRLVTAEDAVPN